MGSGTPIRGRIKAVAGSEGTTSQLHCMLSSDWACRSGIAPCSTLGFLRFPRIAPRSTSVRPVLPTDLTRRATLGALLRLRIAPHSTHCACAVGGSPRLTDYSVFSTWNSCPLTDCSVLDACTLRRSRIAPRSTLCTLRRARIAPRSTLGPPCRSTDCSVR